MSSVSRCSQSSADFEEALLTRSTGRAERVLKKKITHIFGYFPGVGIVTGTTRTIFHAFQIWKERNDLNPHTGKHVVHIVRGIGEISTIVGFGYLILPTIDIGKWIYKRQTSKESVPAKNASRAKKFSPSKLLEPSLIKLTDSPDNNQNISNEKSSFQSQPSEKSYSKSTDFSSKNSFNSSTDGPNNDQKISDEKSSLQSQPSEKSSSTSHASSRSSSDCSDNNQKILAIVNIQSAYRRHRAHLALKKLQVEKLEEQKSLAAVNIQRIWRGYSARLKVEKAKKPLLSYSLLEKAKPYIDNPSNLEGIPEASSGKTLTITHFFHKINLSQGKRLP